MEDQKKNQVFRSFREFKKKFYPTPPKQELITMDDPYVEGEKLAQKSLTKLKKLLALR